MEFVESAFELLSTLSTESSAEKIIMLVILIKDRFKYCFELVDEEKLEGYYMSLLQLVHSFGTKSLPIFGNLAETLAILYINYFSLRFTLSKYLEVFTQNEKTVDFYFKVL